MSNQSFQSGERRVEEPPKELTSRIQSRPLPASNPVPLPLVVTHAATQHSDLLKSYQAKTTGRAIAPAPGTLPKTAIHQMSGLTPATLKKAEVQKTALPLTGTSSMSSVPIQTAPGGSGTIPNIIQISSTTASHGISALQVPNVSSIIRGASSAHASSTSHHPTAGFSHLPRGIGVAANSALVKPAHSSTLMNLPRPMTPTAIQMPAAGAAHIPPNLHSQIRGTLTRRAGTPPSNRAGSPAVSVGAVQQTESHRAGSISLHSVTTAGTTPSIQITLQASRGSSEPVRPTSTYQPPKVHVNQGLSMAAQPKVVLSQSVTPVMQHPTLAAKSNKGPPMSSAPISTVTVTLATTSVTIPIISTTATTTSSIPIAKVPPQRQQQQQQQQHHPQPSQTLSGASPSFLTGTLEPTTFPQPQPAHSHSVPLAPGHVAAPAQPPAHSQPATSIFITQPQRASPSVTSAAMSLANTIGGQQQEPRDGMPTMPFFPPYMLSPENNPYYAQFLRCQVAAVQAQAQQGRQSGLLQTPSPNLAASLQANTPHIAPATSQSVRLNPMMVAVPDALRHSTPPATQPQFAASTETTATTVASTGPTDIVTSVATLPVSVSVAPAVAVASNLYTANTQPSNVPHVGQQAPNTPNSSTSSNPSASPRPSILRKRTNEGVAAVKKQLAMTSTSESHSPRPESRPDSTPQSNMSSPKTPASGESQSSTDTALSSEGTTPTSTTQNSLGEVRVKQEPQDPLENGFQCNNLEASPRKKPRKQLLHATEELKDTPSTDDDFDKLDGVKEEKPESPEIKPQIKDEYVDEDGVRWTLDKKRPPVNLLNFYNISWKPKNNHFQRYVDVKPKEERRPTVNELSNQKGVLQKASGWKLFHMAAQIEDLVQLEKELNEKISGLQATIAPRPPAKHSVLEDESGMLHELTQGNIQRCQLISDQLGDAKSAMLKVLDHKNRILEIITKHMSKRPIKKKERT